MDRNRVAGHMFLHGIRWGLFWGVITGLVLGFPIFLIGALFGLIFGGVIGAFVGMATGAIAGVTTTLFFYPLKNTLLYRRVMGAVCVISAVGFTLIGVLKVSSAPPYVFLPTVLAAFIAVPASDKLASWYIDLQRDSR